MVDSLLVEVFGGDDEVDNVLLESGSDLLVGDGGGMLSGDYDSVNSDGGDFTISLLLVFDGDLRLGVGSEPRENSLVSAFTKTSAQVGGEDVGKRHHFGCLIGGISEHVSLISSTNFFDGASFMNSLSNIGALLFDGDQNVASLVIESLGRIIESDSLNGITDDLLVINLGLGGNFTENEDHSSLGCGFTSNFAVWVFGEASIQNGVGDLIADLVRVSLSYALRGEEKARVLNH